MNNIVRYFHTLIIHEVAFGSGRAFGCDRSPTFRMVVGA